MYWTALRRPGHFIRQNFLRQEVSGYEKYLSLGVVQVFWQQQQELSFLEQVFQVAQPLKILEFIFRITEINWETRIKFLMPRIDRWSRVKGWLRHPLFLPFGGGVGSASSGSSMTSARSSGAISSGSSDTLKTQAHFNIKVDERLWNYYANNILNKYEITLQIIFLKHQDESFS